MGQQKESKLSRRIMDAIRSAGYFCFKVHGGPTMTAGLPDIIVCARGIFIGLETKNPESRGNVSPIQTHIHSMIQRAGGYVAVVCSPSEALEVIEAALLDMYGQDDDDD